MVLATKGTSSPLLPPQAATIAVTAQMAISRRKRIRMATPPFPIRRARHGAHARECFIVPANGYSDLSAAAVARVLSAAPKHNSDNSDTASKPPSSQDGAGS
jgi:hypothetical protein